MRTAYDELDMEAVCLPTLACISSLFELAKDLPAPYGCQVEAKYQSNLES